MKKNFGQLYKETYISILSKTMNFIRTFYILAYNLYGFYWFYKIVVDPKTQCDWEAYALWFFAMTAQLFFTMDVHKANKDIDMREYMKQNLPKSK
ncbi:MAG: hypothetical protein A3D31_02305 [Candidatus Fluviicola riflensis]|nr:MAG: hypothetical protein CHH17_12735 [Candidatus Fluviicola riflensis]OGS78827.1 MAG: hypothetical protein A3D31_02305 [Candidatus Fluviicola riflensis]OGS85849.1 MAG: hypothetical protein A3E30_09790 [Fluviicola sp. RIFCSPHIGHO2_12_FULL_43_24]OGS86258.1 MAG: hypothetical protein A2724_01760 [Fluviicola sp. RIFCSPHIGHO2_01_FULL_43_53]